MFWLKLPTPFRKVVALLKWHSYSLIVFIQLYLTPTMFLWFLHKLVYESEWIGTFVMFDVLSNKIHSVIFPDVLYCYRLNKYQMLWKNDTTSGIVLTFASNRFYFRLWIFELLFLLYVVHFPIDSYAQSSYFRFFRKKPYTSAMTSRLINHIRSIIWTGWSHTKNQETSLCYWIKYQTCIKNKDGNHERRFIEMKSLFIIVN